jgi:hypothetical protein
MISLIKKPFWRDVYWKSAIILGPSHMCFFTLSNDLHLNKGQNKFKIIAVYTLMTIPSLWFLIEFNYFKNFLNLSWVSLIKLLCFNSVFFIISERFQWVLLKSKFDEYNEQNGEYMENISLSSIAFPLVIVFLVYQLFIYLVNCF